MWTRCGIWFFPPIPFNEHKADVDELNHQKTEKRVKLSLNLFQMSVHNPALGKTAKDRGKSVGEIVNETAIMKEQVRIWYLILSASSKLLVALIARISVAI